MPTRYFGRTNQFFGRPLWEILMNLKDFGKGRIVTKSAYYRYFQEAPSFYKIVDVQPHVLEYPDDFRGNIFVEEVFRGRKRANVIDIGNLAGVADYELVHKDQEAMLYKKMEEFLAKPENQKPIIRPRTAPLPPVWKLIIARERNISPKDVPEIPLCYEDIDPELKHPTRTAEEGEEPDYKIGPGHFEPLHPAFYEHVIWNRDAAREKYCNRPPPSPEFVYLDTEIPPLEIEKYLDTKKPSDQAKSQ